MGNTTSSLPHLPDVELLAHFRQRRDEAAFAELVRRHGPVVRAACRRILGETPDAEDAFQATFLILARKAATLRSANTLGPWLHTVAVRAASRALSLARRRLAHERQVINMPEPVRGEAPPANDLLPLLDVAIQRLPERLRVPLVLCELQGMNRGTAARQLGIPEGTLSSRLARGRGLLRKRLLRLGVVVAEAGLTAAFLHGSEAIASSLLTKTTTGALSGAMSPSIAALTQGVLKTMVVAKLKIAAIVVLTLGSVTGVIVVDRFANLPAEEPKTETKNAEEAKSDKDKLQENSTERVWDAATGTEKLALKGHTGPVTSVTFSPDGKYIVTEGYDNTARVWDAQTGIEKLALKEAIGPLAFSPDGKRIVTGSADNTARLWDADTGTQKLALKHTGVVSSVAFSPDGKRIVTGSGDNTARLWDADTGTEKLALKGHTSGVTSVLFSPDGKRIVTGSQDRSVRVWDAETGAEKLALKGHTNAVTSVALSPDGKRIVTGSQDRTVRVWDAETGNEMLALKGHTGPVTSVAFSPDGKRIVTGSYDNTVRVWDAQTGVEKLALKGAGRPVAFSPDGKHIVTGSHDKTVRVWDAQTGQQK